MCACVCVHVLCASGSCAENTLGRPTPAGQMDDEMPASTAAGDDDYLDDLPSLDFGGGELSAERDGGEEPAGDETEQGQHASTPLKPPSAKGLQTPSAKALQRHAAKQRAARGLKRPSAKQPAAKVLKRPSAKQPAAKVLKRPSANALAAPAATVLKRPGAKVTTRRSEPRLDQWCVAPRLSSPPMERMPKAGMSSADKAKYLGVTANTWRRMVRSGMPIVFFNVLFVLAMDLGQPTRTRWCVEYPHSTLNKTIFKFLQNEELYYRTLPGLY